MKYRKPRIAWSVACGIVCLLLIALCVRSYTLVDEVCLHMSANSVQLWSMGGRVRFNGAHYEGQWDYEPQVVSSQPIDTSNLTFPQFDFMANSLGTTSEFVLMLPHWWLAVLTLAIAAIPWIRWRFNLRTLLIGVTLVALGLGWIVVAMRR